MKNVFTIFAVMFMASAFGQQPLYLEFHPKVAGVDYVLNTTVDNLSGTAMNITDFNYYISNIHVIHDGGQDLDLSDTVIIVKGDAYEFDLGDHVITSVEQINFGVGVPQAINHLDITQYPSGHPLSFHTPSMHWGWTSGYKFLLCDGQGDSNGDGTPDAIFQLHNVGDANYKNVSLPIAATAYPTHNTIVVNCNMDEWIFGANPGTTGVQHGETGINAATMSNVESRPVFTAPANANIEELENGTLYFVNLANSLKLVWKDVTSAASYQLIDMAGNLVEQGAISSMTSEQEIFNLVKGQYIFTIYNGDGATINSIKLVR